MRILIFGVGVIGSIYGARLIDAGYSVTFLARGTRKADIEAHGLLLHDEAADTRHVFRPEVVDNVHGSYDLAIITLRNAQLSAALPQIGLLPKTTAILFMLNCPLRVNELVEMLGGERTFFGFPGAGGIHDGPLVRYTAVRQQPTTFGPVQGQSKEMPTQFAKLFSHAGFATECARDMEAWLLTHAVLICALCGALYRNGGRSSVLARNTDSLSDMIEGLSEGLAAIRHLGFTPSPSKLPLLAHMPRFIGRHVLSRLFASDFAKFAIDGHANAAPDDMQDLSDDCRTIVRKSGLPAPTLLKLCDEIDAFAARKNSGFSPSH